MPEGTILFIIPTSFLIYFFRRKKSLSVLTVIFISDEHPFFFMDGSATHEQFLMRQSDILIADGQYEKAISCLDEILKEHPDNEHALSMKGFAYCLMGDSEKGIECLEEALEIDPCSKEVLIIFADACLRSSMPERSLEILDKAISFYPDDDGLVMLKEVIIMVRNKNDIDSSLN